MAIQPTELFGAAKTQTPNLRAFPYQDGVRPGTLVALAADLDIAHLMPLSKVDASGHWALWSATENAQLTITSDATPATAGTWTLTVYGETTAAIAFDATAAIVQAAVEALGAVDIGEVAGAGSGGGSDLGDASHVVTLDFSGQLAGQDPNPSADFSGLTGNAHVLAEVIVGGGEDTGQIDGLLWVPGPDPHKGLAAGETDIQVFRRGLVHAADVPLPAGESQANLDISLKNQELRKKGIEVQGLAGIG